MSPVFPSADQLLCAKIVCRFVFMQEVGFIEAFACSMYGFHLAFLYKAVGADNSTAAFVPWWSSGCDAGTIARCFCGILLLKKETWRISSD